MASFYHAENDAAATALTDNTKWCSRLNNTLAATAVGLQAGAGFGAKAKCTW